MPVRFADAQVEGITALQRVDVACAEQLGFRVKLLGVARRREEGVELRVQPALVPATHLLAQVNGSMNGIMVKADAAGITMYYGAGAGSEQTASAVIADLVDVARLDGTHAGQRVPHTGFHAHAVRELPVLPRAAVRSAHYLRVPVQAATDIAAVAELLAAQRLPVRQLVLASGPADAPPQVLVITESALQGAVDLVLHALQASPIVVGPVIALRVETLDD